MEANKYQESLDDLTNSFNKRMDAFEVKMQQSGSPTQTSTDLSAEFAPFRSFISQVLTNLQQQVTIISSQTDQLEMRSRRKMLLIHGLAESKDEDTATVATKLVVEKLGVSNFAPGDISRCHRMGRSAGDRIRPILVKFKNLDVRDQVWSSKTRLKGTGTTLSEFLTKRRHDAFIAARQKFGVAQCWTREGFIHIIAPDGSRHRLTTIAELNRIPSSSAPAASAAAATGAPTKQKKTQKPATTRPVRTGRK